MAVVKTRKLLMSNILVVLLLMVGCLTFIPQSSLGMTMPGTRTTPGATTTGATAATTTATTSTDGATCTSSYYDLLVVGGGSAGLTAAKFAATFGKVNIVLLLCNL